MLANIALIALGFILLSVSARLAVKKLIRVSRHFAVPEFLTSFLLVGTLSIFPELSIAINSAIQGSSNFGLGILFGSNIADLTLVIGLVAIVSGGMKLDDYAIKKAGLFIGAVLLPVLLVLDGSLSRFDGAILLGAFLLYVFNMVLDRKGWPHTHAIKQQTNVPVDLLVLALSVFVLFFSGSIVTDSALAISSSLAVPVFFIGTIIAVGTCLPEFTFALNASKSRHYGIGFGDILGNVFADSLGSIGLIALVNPVVPEFPSLVAFSGLLMVLAMLSVLFIISRHKKISREHGFVLALLFAFFIAVQVLAEMAVKGGWKFF